MYSRCFPERGIDVRKIDSPRQNVRDTRCKGGTPRLGVGTQFWLEFSWKEHFMRIAIKEADHALALGHEQAEIVQSAARTSNWQKAGTKNSRARVLIEYIQGHPRTLQPASSSSASRQPSAVTAGTMHLRTGSSQLRDSTSPSHCPCRRTGLPAQRRRKGTSRGTEDCVLTGGSGSEGRKVESEEFAQIGRYTATEFLEHESINKWELQSFRKLAGSIMP